jgi:hypothetical protein
MSLKVSGLQSGQKRSGQFRVDMSSSVQEFVTMYLAKNGHEIRLRRSLELQNEESPSFGIPLNPVSGEKE